MNAKDFQDINLIGVDKEKTKVSSRNAPLYEVYLELSENPPSQWIKFFNDERSFVRHSMWREAKIQSKYVVVECALEELEKYHVKDIKLDVENTNKKYKSHLLQQNNSKSKRKYKRKKRTKEKIIY